jgi:hypothetical protein
MGPFRGFRAPESFSLERRIILVYDTKRLLELLRIPVSIMLGLISLRIGGLTYSELAAIIGSG